MKLIEKGANIQLTKNLNSKEIDCKCTREDCTFTLYSEKMVEAFQKVRDEVGPIKINSGFRCQAHNTSVGGKVKSRHCRGTACDLVSSLPLEEFAPICKKHFDYIQVYWAQNFIHCHMEE